MRRAPESCRSAHGFQKMAEFSLKFTRSSNHYLFSKPRGLSVLISPMFFLLFLSVLVLANLFLLETQVDINEKDVKKLMAKTHSF